MPHPFRLGWFLGNGFGVHGWNQAWGGVAARDWCKPGTLAETAAEVSGDGFMVTGPLTPRYLAEITGGLVPALQARGLVRTGYAHGRLRDTLFEFCGGGKRWRPGKGVPAVQESGWGTWIRSLLSPNPLIRIKAGRPLG